MRQTCLRGAIVDMFLNSRYLVEASTADFKNKFYADNEMFRYLITIAKKACTYQACLSSFY